MRDIEFSGIRDNEPDAKLVWHGWRFRQTPSGEYVYAREGFYAWHDRDAAWDLELKIIDGLPTQYPTELVPPFIKPLERKDER